MVTLGEGCKEESKTRVKKQNKTTQKNKLPRTEIEPEKEQDNNKEKRSTGAGEGVG